MSRDGSRRSQRPAGRAGRKRTEAGPDADRPSDGSPRRRFRSGHFVRFLLIAASVVVAATLGASSVRTWIDQRDQLDDARREASELDERIASLEAEIATRTSDEGARIEALCFGPYVEPGVEVYSIPGIDGCVSGS